MPLKGKNISRVVLNRLIFAVIYRYPFQLNLD